MSYSRECERVAYGLYKRITFANLRKWHYLKVLQRLHEIVQPQWYFEIGIRRGHSLRLAQCPAIGVDPAYDLLESPHADSVLVRQTSDNFFATPLMRETLGAARIDLAFIDGWHNSEFVIRDFMHTEPFCNPAAAIVLDDVLPRTSDQAVRKPHGRAWTGDVWKAAACLVKHRPDLTMTFIDCLPTGLLVIQGLSPSSTVLTTRYPEIETDLIAHSDQLMPPRSYRKAFCSATRGLSRVQEIHRRLSPE